MRNKGKEIKGMGLINKENRDGFNKQEKP